SVHLFLQSQSRLLLLYIDTLYHAVECLLLPNRSTMLNTDGFLLDSISRLTLFRLIRMSILAGTLLLSYEEMPSYQKVLTNNTQHQHEYFAAAILLVQKRIS